MHGIVAAAITSRLQVDRSMYLCCRISVLGDWYLVYISVAKWRSWETRVCFYRIFCRFPFPITCIDRLINVPKMYIESSLYILVVRYLCFLMPIFFIEYKDYFHVFAYCNYTLNLQFRVWNSCISFSKF